MKSLLIESDAPIIQDYYSNFLDFACEQLGIPECPPVQLVSKTGSSSFGNYNISTTVITVATDGRHVADILRTIAHELVHEAQHMNGSPTVSLEELEYQANAVAGMIMREYNKLHPELYDADDIGSDGQLDDSGNPGAAQGSLENSGVTVDAFQTPSYEEGGLDDGQPMRPPYPVEMAEGQIVSTDSDALRLLKLQNKALRAFPSSPKQKAIQHQIKELQDKMKKENTPEYRPPLKEEAPVNSVSSGGVDGIGFGSKGEPGIHPSKRNKGQVLKRKTLKQFRHGLIGGSL